MKNKMSNHRVNDSNDTKQFAISVVIPLYNKQEHILGAIRSVLKQTYLPLEVIVVDDGSTDNSAKIVRNELEDQVVLIEQKNAGVSVARNTGIKAASGKYIAFLDADDCWSVHFLQEIIDLANALPHADLLATSYQYVDGESSYSQPKVRISSQAKKSIAVTRRMNNYFEIAAAGDLPFCASSVAIKKSFFALHGYFPEGESMGEDQWIWSLAALKSHIGYSPRALSFYNRVADNRACEQQPPTQECSFSRRLYVYSTNVTMSKQQQKHAVKYTAAHILDLAERNVCYGNLLAAKSLLSDCRCLSKPLKYLKVMSLLYVKFFKNWSVYLSDQPKVQSSSQLF